MVNRRVAIMKRFGQQRWEVGGRVTGEGERRLLCCVFHTVQPASADHDFPRGVFRSGNGPATRYGVN